jgi:hypothetical protein
MLLHFYSNSSFYARILLKWMSEGNGRMSILKKAGGTTGD